MRACCDHVLVSSVYVCNINSTGGLYFNFVPPLQVQLPWYFKTLNETHKSLDFNLPFAGAGRSNQ